MKLIAVVFCLFSSAVLHAQSWLWTKRVNEIALDKHSTNNDNVAFSSGLIATDEEENIIHANGVVFRTPNTSTYSIRLAKYDHTGNTIWIKYFEKPALYNGGSFITNIYDLKVDKIGNIYLLMRNFTLYDSVATPGDNNVVNCLFKVNPQGRFIWKKPIGAIEDVVAAPQYARIAMSPDPSHFYAFIDLIFPSLQFLDSTYTKVAGTNKMILCKIDSSGKLIKDLKIPGAKTTDIYAGFDVSGNDDVLISAGGLDVSLADTSFSLQNAPLAGANFYSLLRGSDLSRKWTKLFGFENTTVFNNNIIDAKITTSGNIGFLLEPSRSGSDGQASKLLRFGNDTVRLYLNSVYENPVLVITDLTGKLVTGRILVKDTRMIVRGSRLEADKQNNFYFSGCKSFYANSNVWLRPSMFKTDNKGVIQWMNQITGIDSGYTMPPFVAAQTDYPLFLAVIGYTPQPVFGPDTLALPPCTYCGNMILMSFGGHSNTIRGKVFRDYNFNDKLDAGEDVIPNNLITSNNGAFNSFTDRNGNYLLVVDSGAQQVTAAPKRFYSSHPSAYNLSFTNTGNSYPGKDFAFRPDTLVNEVSIDVTEIGIPRPGSEPTIQVSIRNNGTLPTSGSYSVKFDNQVSFVQSDSFPVFTFADSIVWNYATLKPEREIINNVRIHLPTTLTPGEVKRVSGFVNPYASDSMKENNKDTCFFSIRASLDPNDKEVFPFHNVLIDSIQSGKSLYEYTIRFQNTGNDTAFNIHIVDTLSSRLDFSTIKLVSSSHPVTLEWSDPSLLHFYFRNILLPDSNVNERRSHGFVKFSIRPKASLQLQDSITNKAAIYFDYNLPVITNKVVSQFRTNVITGINSPSIQGLVVKVYPNPVNQNLEYSVCCLSRTQKLQLQVVDVYGRTLIDQTKTVAGQLNGSINVNRLPAGIYFLKINSNKDHSIIKFMKSR